MPNLFFRTNIAPYRIDTYNAFHKKLKCEMFFYWNVEHSQKMNMRALERLCHFYPQILNGFEIKIGRNDVRFAQRYGRLLKQTILLLL